MRSRVHTLAEGFLKKTCSIRSPFLAVDAGAGGAEGALADAHDAQDVLIALAFMLQNGEEDVRMSMRQLIEIERVKISSKSLHYCKLIC